MRKFGKSGSTDLLSHLFGLVNLEYSMVANTLYRRPYAECVCTRSLSLYQSSTRKLDSRGSLLSFTFHLAHSGNAKKNLRGVFPSIDYR